MTPDHEGQTAPDGPAGALDDADLVRAVDEERRKVRVLAAFFQDAAGAAATDDRSVWQVLIERAGEAIGDSGVVSLVSEDGDWLVGVGVYHPDPARAAQIRGSVARRPLDGTVYGDVIRRGATLFIPFFAANDPSDSVGQMSDQQRQILARSDTHSIIAVPLMLGGRVAGVLAVSRGSTSEPYSQADVEIVQALAASASVVLDNAATHRDLRAATVRLETIIAESPIATVVLDAEHRVTTWGAANEELLGWSAAEMEGRPLPPELLDPDGVGSSLGARLAAGETIRGAELTLRDRAGDAVSVALYAAPVREVGEVTGSVLRWVDLTERVRLEQQLGQAQRLESLGQLAGGVAHDFNNILTAIIGFAELIDDELPTDDPNRSNVRAIVDAGDRATSLVRQLLAFGRQQIMRPESLDLGEVVGQLVPMLRRVIGEHVAIGVSTDSELWRTEADRSQLEQVIVNLAVNARDAMPGGGRLTIETRNIELDDAYADTHPEVTPGPHVMLAVSDTGTGIDPATLTRIFEPFFTTKEAGHGTGLGLATVYGIVRQSGGHIWVYTEPAQGTTFRLYFPRAEAPAEVEAVAVASPAQSAAQVAGTGTILVAEDEEILRALIELVLGRLGYTVLMAPDPATARDIARTHEIDLLVTDVVMPGGSGIDLAAAIREMQPSVRVLFISGYTAAALEPQGMSFGDELLQKPFTPDSLGRAVRDALARGA